MDLKKKTQLLEEFRNCLIGFIITERGKENPSSEYIKNESWRLQVVESWIRELKSLRMEVIEDGENTVISHT